MPLVIEKGYLFIAQPPLFKVKKGRTERYIQNETEMQNMLFELASDDLEIPLRGQFVKGKGLIPHLKRLYRFERLRDWFERRRRDPELLMFILSLGINKEMLKDKPKFGEILRKIKEKDQSITLAEIQLDEEHQTYGVEVRRHNYKLNLDINFLTSPEFRELENFYSIIRVLGPPYRIQTKEGPK